jgi:hypothetical protein
MKIVLQFALSLLMYILPCFFIQNNNILYETINGPNIHVLLYKPLPEGGLGE